jgi:DHA2 family multidrug resistance protein
MTAKSLLALVGILLAAMTSEFNDLVTSIALADVRGGFAISRDPGTWIQSLYISAEIVGMAVSAWCMVTFSMRRWTLFSISLCGAPAAALGLSPEYERLERL